MGFGSKLTRYFLEREKTYLAHLQFGVKTDSGDETGKVISESLHFPSSQEKIQTAMNFFSQAPYFQTPPMHSAKKIEGTPLYELARQGLEVEREKKCCKISLFHSIEYTPPHLTFRAEVSSGTFIRTLGEDLAEKLGTVAHLRELRREKSCSFSVENALTLDQLIESQDWSQGSSFIPFDRVLEKNYASLFLDEREAREFLSGHPRNLRLLGTMIEERVVLPNDTAPGSSCEKSTLLKTVAVYDEKKRLIGVAARVDVTPESPWSVERGFLPELREPAK